MAMAAAMAMAVAAAMAMAMALRNHQSTGDVRGCNAISDLMGGLLGLTGLGLGLSDAALEGWSCFRVMRTAFATPLLSVSPGDL
jgi:hypothetical protein